MALSSDVWFPAVTLAGGIVLNEVLGWVREARSVRRERGRRRADFRRENLAELQEALSSLMRGYEDAYGLRLVSVADGEKQRPALPEDLRIRILDAERRVTMLASRIDDEAVKKHADEITKRGTVATWGASFNRADDAFLDARISAEEAMNRTGELMRKSLG